MIACLIPAPYHCDPKPALAVVTDNSTDSLVNLLIVILIIVLIGAAILAIIRRL